MAPGRFIVSGTCFLVAVSGFREVSRTAHMSSGSADACDTSPGSCECFAERDPLFCSTCPNCGPCSRYCSGLSPAPTPECNDVGAQLEDTDLSGTYLAQHNSIAKVEDCCPLCEELEGCQGFAYSDANKACYLKGDFLGTFPNPGVVTRLKTTLGAGCPRFGASLEGKDVAGTLLEDWAAPNSEACCASCGSKPGCEGFSYFDGRCYLKSAIQGTFDKPGCITRVRGGFSPPTPAPTTAEPTPAPTQAPTTPAPTLAPTPASEQCLEFKSLMWETDMSGTYLAQHDGVESSDGCCSFCDEQAGCEGFSYNAANRACYLKGDFIGTFPNGGAVTGLRSSLGAGCPGFDEPHEGKDLVGTLTEQWAAPDQEACCASCARKEGCQGFTFFDGQCYLKAAVGGTYDNEGRITRVKAGVLPSA